MGHDDRDEGLKTDIESVDSGPSLDREEDFHDRQLRMTSEALDEADRARAEADEESADTKDDVIQPSFRVYFDEPESEGRLAQIKSTVSDAFESAKQTIGQKVSELRERASDALEDLKEKVSQKFGDDKEPEPR